MHTPSAHSTSAPASRLATRILSRPMPMCELTRVCAHPHCSLILGTLPPSEAPMRGCGLAGKTSSHVRTAHSAKMRLPCRYTGLRTTPRLD